MAKLDTRCITEELALNPSICPIIAHWKEIIHIALKYQDACNGALSREIIMFLSLDFPGEGLTPIGGISPIHKRNLKKVLMMAGFEMRKCYRKESQKSERVWRIRKNLTHLTLHEIENNYANKLIDFMAVRNLI